MLLDSDFGGEIRGSAWLSHLGRIASTSEMVDEMVGEMVEEVAFARGPSLAFLSVLIL